MIKMSKDKLFLRSVFIILLVTITYVILFLVSQDENLIFDKTIVILNNISTTKFIIYLFLTQILGIMLHEIIHALVCIIFTQNINSIKLGFIPKQMMFYCNCKYPLYVNHYLLMIIAPFILMGVFPYILGLYLSRPSLIFFGYLFSIAAVGDIYIIYLILKNYQKKFIKDSDTEVGGEYIN